MQHHTAVCGCIVVRLFAMPLHGVDRLYSLTESTPSVYLCFDSKTRRGKVFCVAVYALYKSVSFKATKNMRNFYLVRKCLTHRKKV